mgnify:CR=1 FL=1|tara:strand:- start:5536 stop:6225 length:690 start_codon:yes stop_codon:yes gene_type:complete
MTKSILMMVTSNDRLGENGGATGSWLEELAAAYYVFVDAGHKIGFASTRAGVVPIDPASLEDPWVTEAGRRFLEDESVQTQLGEAQAIEAVDPSNYDAIYMVGGAGTAWDFPDNTALASVVEAIDRNNGIVSAVCHGVLGLAGANDSSGEALVKGRQVTGVSNNEEVLTEFDKIVPLLPEDKLGALGGVYTAADEPFGCHVVRDRNLITGQNPASAGPLAQAVLSAMAE